MTVSAEKGLWHCFGCGEGGDVIAFLMKIERLSFVDAAKRLAEVWEAADGFPAEVIRGTGKSGNKRWMSFSKKLMNKRQLY